jgi:phage FluMu protein Com
MEKIITCTKCQKTFKVSGPHSSMKEVPQGVTCPFCRDANELMWPMDTGFTTIPKKQTPKKAAPNTGE